MSRRSCSLHHGVVEPCPELLCTEAFAIDFANLVGSCFVSWSGKAVGTSDSRTEHAFGSMAFYGCWFGLRWRSAMCKITSNIIQLTFCTGLYALWPRTRETPEARSDPSQLPSLDLCCLRCVRHPRIRARSVQGTRFVI